MYFLYSRQSCLVNAVPASLERQRPELGSVSIDIYAKYILSTRLACVQLYGQGYQPAGQATNTLLYIYISSTLLFCSLLLQQGNDVV